MKKIYSGFFFALFLLLFAGIPHAQNLDDLFEIAHYSLINTAEDNLGNLDPIVLDNTPFDGNDGVFSNGIYPGEDPKNGSYIRTPFVESLYDSVFAVQLEFRIADSENVFRPVVMLGESYRYLGFETRFDNQFMMVLNNTEHVEVPGYTAILNQWYDLIFIHHEQGAYTEFYLDGTLVGILPGALDRPDDDGRILNSNLGQGRTFWGHWRNLRIYGADEITSLYDQLRQDDVVLFPNLVTSELHVDLRETDASNWYIIDAVGKLMLNGKVSGDNVSINTSSLNVGVYSLQLVNTKGIIIAQRRFFKKD